MRTLEALRAFTRPLARRLALVVGRGVLRLSDDAGGLQRLQSDFLAGEVRGPLERFGQFGWTSRPPIGSEVIALFPSGSRDRGGVVVAVEDRRVRPVDLAEGEAAAYNAHGVLVLLKADGSIEITAAGGVRIEAPSLELSGSLTVHGSVDVDGSVAAAGEVADALGPLSEMRQDYNLHTHPGVETGSGTTGPPVPPME